ncbi:DUF642 domain-containing protein [Streptomyces roseolus]|uniref:DUF642 domain-containing protein n=1 Tax=Streptomyces roseolus TaxID=67358 RepID=UPI00340591C5
MTAWQGYVRLTQNVPGAAVAAVNSWENGDSLMPSTQAIQRGLIAVAAASAFTATAAVPAHAAPDHQYLPLTNPSFNQPQLASGYQGVGAGNSTIPGWTVTGTVDVESAEWAKTGSASQAVSLNGSSMGGISQALPTTPGRTVSVTFRYGTETWTGCDTTKSLRFTVSGAGPDSDRLINAGTPDKANPNWRTATYTFTAQSRISHLRFDSVIDGHCGAVITDVTAEE